jgi:cysteine synthase A
MEGRSPIYVLSAALGCATAAALLASYLGCAPFPPRPRPPPPPPPPPAPAPPAEDLLSLVGNTPLLRIPSLSNATGCDILGKCEFLSVGGSGKDRVAAAILAAAAAGGALAPGGLVCEGTSGSTGISLALLARARGYRARIFLPSDAAPEKAALLRRLGAEVVVTEPVSPVNAGHYVARARAAAAAEPPGAAIFANQFESPANWAAHASGTAPELLAQLRGRRAAALVMGAGTGGTLGAVGEALKAAAAAAGAPPPRVVLADPPGSVLLRRVAHGVAWAPSLAERTLRRARADTLVEGVGLDRVTPLVERALRVVDEALEVPDADTVAMSRHLLREDGLFLGSSSALHCAAAAAVARALGPGHTVVTFLCDGGARHASRFWDDGVVRRVAAERGDAALAEALGEGAEGSRRRGWLV